MNTPWILGTIGAIAFFGFFEWYAFRHPERQNTLSRWIYDLGRNWPLSIWLMGMLAGGLAVHFFWHWCPAGSISTGWLIEQIPVAALKCFPGPEHTNTLVCNL